METFYFGRLNYESKYSILELLTHGNRYRPSKRNNIRFGIFEVEIIQDNILGNIFTGELVKYQDLKEEPVVKENLLSIEYIKDVIMGKSRFYLMENEHLIAYNPYGKIISQKAFCDAFSGVIIGADDSFDLDSVIYPVNQEYEFLSFLYKMRSLSKLTIKLTPSNPNNRELWKRYDDRLNNMNVKSSEEKMIAKENQSIKIDDEAKSKIAMAQDGYGKAIGEGTDSDGIDITISTDEKDSIIKKKIDSELGIYEQLHRLRTIFEKIISRFK